MICHKRHPQAAHCQTQIVRSIAPIKSKGHLNFNVWVSCASLQGMLEALYVDIDSLVVHSLVVVSIVLDLDNYRRGLHRASSRASVKSAAKASFTSQEGPMPVGSFFLLLEYAKLPGSPIVEPAHF